MRKVYLDELPHRIGIGVNAGKEVIDWELCIGYSVKFEYDNMSGELEILNYAKEIHRVYVLYGDKQFDIKSGNLTRAKLGNILGVKTREYKYAVGCTVNNNKILEQIRVRGKCNTARGYLCECLKCKDLHTVTEHQLNTGYKCPVCRGLKIKIGYNDLWTTHPHIAKLLKNPEDGYKYTHGSGVKLDWKCPDCGTIKNNYIFSVVLYRLGCGCSDRIPYPEKFVRSMLTQLGTDFESQYSPEWARSKRYDEYSEKLNCIIEVHGRQHYSVGFSGLGGRTLEEEQENDKLKEQLAKENGIKNYIAIDARESELEFIKESILNSELYSLLDLSRVDWLKCHEYACKNIAKEVCELWDSGNYTDAHSFAKEVGLTYNTILRCLKQGAKLGWCNYSAEEAVRARNIKVAGIAKERYVKKVVQINKGGCKLNVFNSMTEAGKSSDTRTGDICSCCKGKYKTAGGYKWMYLEDYEKMINAAG